MGHRLRIINVGRHLARILPCKMAKHIFIFFLTSAEHNKLQIVLAHLIHHIGDQIKSFLVGQTRNNTNHESGIVLLQSEFSLKCPLIFYLLLTEIPNVVLVFDQLICLRIILIVINTIYNTAQTIGTSSHQTIQTFSVKRCLNLFRIRFADCRHRVCINDTAL